MYNDNVLMMQDFKANNVNGVVALMRRVHDDGLIYLHLSTVGWSDNDEWKDKRNETARQILSNAVMHGLTSFEEIRLSGEQMDDEWRGLNVNAE